VVERGALTFFEEKSDFIPTVQKIVIAYMLSSLTGREFCHRVVLKGEVLKHTVGFSEE
jgi:hypothetical protein